MASSAIPRVAVVGGGITGTLASLVLRNRGLHPVIIDSGSAVGGRLRGAARSALCGPHNNNNGATGILDAGAQFLRASDFRFVNVLKMLESAGVVARWKGRFGLMGNRGGGFLPSAVVGPLAAMELSSVAKDGEEGGGSGSENAPPLLHTDAGDFCGFVTHQKHPAYVALPDNASLCSEICRLASIEQLNNATVVRANTLDRGGWELELDSNDRGNNGVSSPDSSSLQFDALVLASHDPMLAAETVQNLVDAEVEASSADENDENEDGTLLQNRLNNLVQDLTSVQRESKQPVFTWAGRFLDDASSPPFDAATVPGSHVVQFLARESSKPGRAPPSDDDGGEIWTAVSTSSLAKEVLDAHGPTRAAGDEAADRISREVASLLGRNSSSSTRAEDGSAVRWGSAFRSKTLDLKEDSVYLHPWRLAIAGDFVRRGGHYPTPLEAGALSGLEAGERIAGLWGDDVFPKQ